MRLTATRSSITSGGGAVLDPNAPSLDLNFADSKSLVDATTGANLVAFTRASSGTYIDSNGLIQTAVTNAPRFDHDPATGESLGLLIERESRTNYCTNSNSPGGWSPTNTASSQTFDAVTAPDGSTITQGFRLPNRTSRVYPTVSSPGTIVPVASIYARAVSGTTTLSLFVQGSIVASDISVPSDRWVRMTGTTTSRTVTAFSVRGNNSQSSDVYLWGAQLEEGSFPTSLIPTSGSTVTRAADVASIEGANFSSWYNQSEGTVFVEVEASGAAPIVGFDDGSTSARWRVGYASSNNSAIVVVDGGVAQTNINTPVNTTPYNQFNKLAGAIAVNNLSLAFNGALTSDSSLSVPVVNALSLGASIGVSTILNGHIARLAYFPTRLPDATLQNITS